MTQENTKRITLARMNLLFDEKNNKNQLTPSNKANPSF